MELLIIKHHHEGSGYGVSGHMQEEMSSEGNNRLKINSCQYISRMVVHHPAGLLSAGSTDEEASS